MDDMNAFERQLAAKVVRMAGADPHFNALEIARTAATQSTRWRFSSMFSATKFVVAGAIVALFGGFLLAGVLTQQPSDDRLPVGASASATAQAESSDVETTEPEPTTETDSTTATPDLLPGVDLVTEEVEPGVYRVLSDGENDLSKNVWSVVVAPSGEVWVEKYRIAGYGGQGVDPGDPRIRDQRWHRLGDPEPYQGPEGLGRKASHCRQPSGPGGSSGPDGSCWLVETHGWLDGLGDDVPAESMIVRVAADGTLQGVSRSDLGLDDDVGQGQGFLAGAYFAFAEDGTAWTPLFENDGDFVGLAAYDGAEWDVIESDPLPGDRIYQDIAVAPDGTVWVAWDIGRSRTTGVSWDGEAWTKFGSVWNDGATPRIGFAPDGRVWFGPRTYVDGSSLRQLQPPTSATNQHPRVSSWSHAPDGSIWVSVLDMRTPKELGCQENSSVCKGVTDGLYVITPEAVAVTE